MKNLFVLLAVMLLGLSACKDNSSTEPEEETGSILIPYFFPNEELGSLDPAPDTISTYVINSQEEFSKLVSWDGRPKTTSIDFSKYTLLGQEVRILACEIPNRYAIVTKDKNTNKYTFNLEISQLRKGCEVDYHIDQWIIIPKIEDDAEIKFNWNEITDKYTFDSLEIEENRKFWLSDSEYGASKNIFKKGESVFVNYIFKNFTGKPLEWFQRKNMPFVNFQINRKKEHLTISPINHTLNIHNGVLKPGEELKYSWRVDKEIPVGTWDCSAALFRDFKNIVIKNRNIEVTIEE